MVLPLAQIIRLFEGLTDKIREPWERPHDMNGVMARNGIRDVTKDVTRSVNSLK
jgi:hypothetical protein